jgi:hypothetical protein
VSRAREFIFATSKAREEELMIAATQAKRLFGRRIPSQAMRVGDEMPTFRYRSDVDECVGDLSPIEILQASTEVNGFFSVFRIRQAQQFRMLTDS